MVKLYVTFVCYPIHRNFIGLGDVNVRALAQLEWDKQHLVLKNMVGRVKIVGHVDGERRGTVLFGNAVNGVLMLNPVADAKGSTLRDFDL